MTREIKPELLDELLSGLSKPEDLLCDAGLFRQLKKALMERALGGELTHHLGYEKGDPVGRGSGNSRNGHSSKTVLGEDGEIDLSIPRDRAGTFEPQLVLLHGRSLAYRLQEPKKFHSNRMNKSGGRKTLV